MTVELGFSYLWIDSLCIIQDSKEDWLIESSRMGEVYKHSSCNIAATGFNDGRRGFFVNRDVDEVICPRLRVEWAGRWYDERLRRGYYHLLDERLWDNEVGNAPLNRRGWVLQERLLSPSVLHFGARQVFWECFEMYSCEIFPGGFPHRVNTPAAFKSLRFYEESIKNETAGTASMDEEAPWERPRKRKAHRGIKAFYESWHDILEAYSITDLTRPEDKFIAISGAARSVRQLSGDIYLAGLWKRSVMRDLLWMVRPESTVSVPVEYRAPTWSWASLNAPISYKWALASESVISGEQGIFHAQFLDAQLSHTTDDDTGLMTGGYIRLKGRLAEARFASKRSWVINGLKVNIEAHLDIKHRFEKPTGCILRNPGNNVLEVWMSSDFEERCLKNDPVYLLPVRTVTENICRVLVGLILYPTGRAKAEYVRLGLFVAGDLLDRTQRIIVREASKLNSRIWGKGEDGQCTIIVV